MTDLPARLVEALKDRHALQRELGRGGVATVYLAEDLKLPEIELSTRHQRGVRRAAALLGAALLAILPAAGCDLDVPNPNAPDALRAFSDPATLTGLLRGAAATWVEARTGYFVEALTTMADSYTCGFSHASMRYYSSVGAECPSRCGWTNSTTGSDGVVQAQWYGYYAVLSSANDMMRAIARGICFDADCGTDNTVTSRNKAIAKMLQGMALSGIALMYDQGFVADEITDLSRPRELRFSTRAEIRDAALQKFDEAWTEAGVRSWSTPSEWMGLVAGRPYSSQQIRQVIRTMQAELIALWPRNAAENAQASWSQVATLASQGISNPAPGFAFEFYIDAGRRYEDMDGVKTVGNSIGSVRVDTRVASMLASNHGHPWPEPYGNPCPTVSADKRVGDGSWGPADNFNGYQTTKATANAGTDFACSRVVIFPPSRGGYHQSNLAHVRYQHLGYAGENLPGFDGTGQDPLYTVQMNDLLWAEGLIRSGGDKTRAAQLINNSRVGRGGLPPLTGTETDTELLGALQYEQEIEFMGQGATPFFNRRRIDGLIDGTPRQMPVPAKDLAVLGREIYTFGGPHEPDMSVVGGAGAARSSGHVKSVREIWEQYRVPKHRGPR